ncbi:hypothetical protein ACFS3C_15410 [Azotobacter vinelandii]
MKDILHDYTHNRTSATSITGRPKAYVETYRAYAVAVSRFFRAGRRCAGKYYRNVQNPTEMGGNYNINNLEELSEYREELQQATNMLYRHYPHGLALLAARPERKPPVEQPIMKKITRKLIRTLQSMEILKTPR